MLLWLTSLQEEHWSDNAKSKNCERLTGERWSEGRREEPRTALGSCSPPSASEPRRRSRDTRTGTGILRQSLQTRGKEGAAFVAASDVLVSFPVETIQRLWSHDVKLRTEFTTLQGRRYAHRPPPLCKNKGRRGSAVRARTPLASVLPPTFVVDLSTPQTAETDTPSFTTEQKQTAEKTRHHQPPRSTCRGEQAKTHVAQERCRERNGGVIPPSFL